jgi:hypothetical protein
MVNSNKTIIVETMLGLLAIGGGLFAYKQYKSIESKPISQGEKEEMLSNMEKTTLIQQRENDLKEQQETIKGLNEEIQKQENQAKVIEEEYKGSPGNIERNKELKTQYNGIKQEIKTHRKLLEKVSSVRVGGKKKTPKKIKNGKTSKTKQKNKK